MISIQCCPITTCKCPGCDAINAVNGRGTCPSCGHLIVPPTVVRPDDQCRHGFTSANTTVVDQDGITVCCAAYSSIFIDDGSEYCKCCYGSVTGGAETERVTVRLS